MTKLWKEFLILILIVIVCAILARKANSGETLYEYAQNNPELAYSKSDSNSANSSSASSSNLSKDDSNKTDKCNSEVSNTYASNNSSSSDNISASMENSTDIITYLYSEEVYEKFEVVSDEYSYEKRITYDDEFYYEPINYTIFDRIYGISFPEDAQILASDLVYCNVMYINFDGQKSTGEIICNKQIADDIIEIFASLYENSYPIESIKLIDEFDGDDISSMEANNTSCFNYREIASSNKLSNHALGLAIDINPLYNPYVKESGDGSITVSPSSALKYVDRNLDFNYKIDTNDLAYKLFTEHGFTWGGSWRSVKDYQHFEKTN